MNFGEKILAKLNLNWGIIVILYLLFTIFVAFPLADFISVVFSYGIDQYNNGLRVVNSKIGLLSNNERLPFFWELTRNIVGITLGIFFTLLLDWLVGFVVKKRESR